MLMDREAGSGEHGRDPIDAVIDDTARALTAGLPSDVLRERVSARLGPRRSSSYGPVWRPALGAAVAALVIWFALPRSDGDSPPVTPPLRTSAPSVEIASPAPSVIETRPPSPAARSARVDARSPRRGEDRFAALANALPPIEPIEIEPVPPSTVARIEQIPTPMPLRIEQLAFERLFTE